MLVWALSAQTAPPLPVPLNRVVVPGRYDILKRYPVRQSRDNTLSNTGCEGQWIAR